MPPQSQRAESRQAQAFPFCPALVIISPGVYEVVGEGASKQALEIPDRFTALPLESPPRERLPEDEELNIEDMRNSLSSLMWRQVGIQRNEADLFSAQKQVEFWDKYVSRREFQSVQGWELQNMLLVARVVIVAALTRQESRGVHTRSDYPETSEEWAVHIPVRSYG